MRELDTAQSRIHDTLQRINLTVDRSSAVDGIKWVSCCLATSYPASQCDASGKGLPHASTLTEATLCIIETAGH